MSHLFSVSYQPVVGTLGKFPNWHLLCSKLYFPIGNLQATIKISISTQLSIKSIIGSIINISHCQILPLAPFGAAILHLMYCQMGNFQYFSFCLACWLLKPWHFGKFHHWPCFVHQVMSHVWSNGKFLIFLCLN